MAALHQLPYLGAINGGAALRSACLKVYSYAQLDEIRGGTFGKDKLVPFLLDMIEIGGKDHGMPSDGQNLGLPGIDPRKYFYTVISALRMYGTADQKESFNAFCWFLINEFKEPDPKPEG